MEKTVILARFWVGLYCYLVPCSYQQQSISFQGKGAQDAQCSTTKSPLRCLCISNNWLSPWNSSWNSWTPPTGIGSVWCYHCTGLGLFYLLGHPAEKQKRGSRSQPNPRAPAKERTCESTGIDSGIRDELPWACKWLPDGGSTVIICNSSSLGPWYNASWYSIGRATLTAVG